MSKKMYHPTDPELAAMKPEQRLALYNNGQIIGQGPADPDADRTHYNERPLTDDQIQRLRGLEREREVLQSLGRDLHPTLRMELGDLLAIHERTGPKSPAAEAVNEIVVNDAVRLAGLRGAKAEAERAGRWAESATIQSEISRIEAEAK